LTDTLIFRVHGTPRPKARPRFVGGRVVTTVGPKEKLWRAWVERAAKEAVANRGDPAPIFLGAVRVRMVFTFKPPQSGRDRVGKPHTQKPDAENCSKLVLDAMERAGVFKNDSQAAQAPPEKWWGMNAGVVVTVEPIDAERAPSAAELDCPDWLSAAR
jgi:Holliday junction resolvase RusA-like endonuclease